VCRAAARLGGQQGQAAADEAGVPSAAAAAATAPSDFAKDTKVGVQLKEMQRAVGRKQAWRSGKHSEALARERSKSAGVGAPDLFSAHEPSTRCAQAGCAMRTCRRQRVQQITSGMAGTGLRIS
jgi:hypothetical protein